MDLSDARRLLSLMSARAPREAVETLLEFLAADHAARLAAIFAANEDRLSLFCCTAMDQVALDWANASWLQAEAKLRRGITLRDRDHALVPIMRSKALAALLYLETADVHDQTILDVSLQLADAMRHALGAATQGAVDVYLETTPEDEIARRKLLLLLERHEWNKARVGRELGLSRQGVYRRMELLGIPLDRPLAKGNR